MDTEQLTAKYLHMIDIEYSDFVHVIHTQDRAAYLIMRIPRTMLFEYSMLKNSNQSLPDGIEFWKDTGLARKLNSHAMWPQHKNTPLEEVLQSLEDDVIANYRPSEDPSAIKLEVIELSEAQKKRVLGQKQEWESVYSGKMMDIPFRAHITFRIY